MAVKKPTIDAPGVNNQYNDFTVVTWDGLQPGDVGEPVELVSYADRSVTVAGSFAGSNVVIEGSNDGVSFFPVRNPFDGQVVVAAGALHTIIDTCRYMRPRVFDGAAASLKVVMLARF